MPPVVDRTGKGRGTEAVGLLGLSRWVQRGAAQAASRLLASAAVIFLLHLLSDLIGTMKKKQSRRKWRSIGVFV